MIAKSDFTRPVGTNRPVGQDDPNDPLKVSWNDKTGADKRTTMPRGGYVFGASNPRLRPNVPKGQ